MDYYFLHGPALRPTRASKTLLFPSPLLPQTERKSAKRSYCEPGDPDADSCIARTAISATDEEPGPPGDSDAALVHEILWNHFGFIPCSPGLDGEAYKLRVSSLSTFCLPCPHQAHVLLSTSCSTRVCAALSSRRCLPSLRGRLITSPFHTRCAHLHAFKRDPLLTRSVFSVPLPTIPRSLARHRHPPFYLRLPPSPPLAYLLIRPALFAPEHG